MAVTMLPDLTEELGRLRFSGLLPTKLGEHHSPSGIQSGYALVSILERLQVRADPHSRSMLPANLEVLQIVIEMISGGPIGTNPKVRRRQNGANKKWDWKPTREISTQIARGKRAFIEFQKTQGPEYQALKKAQIWERRCLPSLDHGRCPSPQLLKSQYDSLAGSENWDWDDEGNWALMWVR